MLVAKLLLLLIPAINIVSTQRLNTANSVSVKVDNKMVVQKKEELRATFQENLRKIKDERKRQVVENLASRIDDINKRWVEHWRNVLDRLAKILDKISSRKEKLASEGKDVTAIENAIKEANIAIASAQEAVNKQADMIYTIEVGSEDKLGQVVSNEIARLREDLKLTRESVWNAHKAVVAALRELKSSL